MSGEAWILGQPRCSVKKERTGSAPTPPAGGATSPGGQSASSAEPPDLAEETQTAKTGPAQTSSADRETPPAGPGVRSARFSERPPLICRRTMGSVKTSRMENVTEPTANLVTTFPGYSCVEISRKGGVSETIVAMLTSRSLQNQGYWMLVQIIRMETVAGQTADFSTLRKTRIPRKISVRISRTVDVPGRSVGSGILTTLITSRNRCPDTVVGPG